MTLCIIRDGDRILLAEKKRGFGVGFWNGYGGKLELGETVEQALVRELQEESGLKLISCEKRGEMEFILADGAVKEVHIFEGIETTGELVETEEMRPQWFDISAIPLQDMWPSDIFWYPFFFRRENFRGRTVFGEHFEVLSQEINPENESIAKMSNSDVNYPLK